MQQSRPNTENEHYTGVHIRNEGRVTLHIHIDDFCAQTFSDAHGDNEYQLVEIDEYFEGPLAVESATVPKP